MNRSDPALRVATPADTDRIEALMKASAAAIFPRFYDERQVASAVRYVADVDPMLLADGTYFIVEADGEAVACGGWSRRNLLYTGSGASEDDGRLLNPATEPARVRGRRIIEACEDAARREGFRELELGATLAGVPLYLACDFEPVEEFDVALSDGVTLECLSMRKAIDV
jgi:hypothetical protein